MTINPYMLDEPFEIKGYWWLPGAAEKRIAGTLNYSVTDLRLELAGSLVEIPSHSFLSTERLPTIHGISYEGNKFTLLNNLPVQAKYAGGEGFVCCSYSALHAIGGFHAAEPMVFGAAELYTTFLNEFVGRDYFAQARAADDESVVTLTVKKAPAMEYCLPGLTLRVKARLNEQHRRHGSVAFNADEHLDIEPATPQPLEWFIKSVWHLCYLLRLLTDEPVKPVQIVLATPGDVQVGSLIYRHDTSEEARQPSALLLFYLAHLHDKFPTMLEKWFALDDMMRTAMHLFMHAHRFADADHEARFLTLAQALETFSRAKGHAVYMPKEEWLPLAEQIAAAIPAGLEEGHVASLNSRLEFGNEYALHKRITLLLSSLSDGGRGIVCESPSKFTKGTAKTRNYLTHYTAELKAEALQGVQLAWACDRVLMLMRILLLKDLGIDEALICDRIKNHGRLSQHINLYKQHPECVS